mgnify:FL=1
MTYGDTQINCEIGRCKGYNGGAIKNIKGTLKVYGDTKIHDCVSVTEGGAIHNSQKGTLSIEDSEIWNCEALEEGGAIFQKMQIVRVLFIQGRYIITNQVKVLEQFSQDMERRLL